MFCGQVCSLLGRRVTGCALRTWRRTLSERSFSHSTSKLSFDERSSYSSEELQHLLGLAATTSSNQGHIKKLYNIDLPAFNNYVRLVGKDTKKVPVLASSMSFEKEVCASPAAAKFILDIVGHAESSSSPWRDDLYGLIRISLGASAVLLHGGQITDVQRACLVNFCQTTLNFCMDVDNMALLASTSLDDSTVVYLFKVLSYSRDKKRTPLFLRLLNDRKSMEGKSRVASLFAIMGVLDVRHLDVPVKGVIFKAMESVNIQELGPSEAAGLATFFRQMMPAVPSNRAQWPQYLLESVDLLELRQISEILELCMRWHVAVASVEPELIACLKRSVIPARCDSAGVENVLALIQPLVLHSHRCQLKSQWTHLAKDVSALLLQRFDSAGLVDGVRLHHSAYCMALAMLARLRTLPTHLLVHWTSIVMRSAADLTFYDFCRVLTAVHTSLRHNRWHGSDRANADPGSAGRKFVAGMAEMPCGDVWLLDLPPNAVSMRRIANVCVDLSRVHVWNAPPVTCIASWLLDRCSFHTQPSAWCLVASLCVRMGVSAERFAYGALPLLASGLALPADQATVLAWLAGPLANLLPETSALHCIQTAAGTSSALPNYLIDLLLTLHAWAGHEEAVPKQTMAALSGRYRPTALPRAASQQLAHALHGIFGAPYVMTRGAGVDYLPVDAVLFFSCARRRFVPVEQHRDWLSCSVAERHHRRQDDVRAVCVLGSTLDRFLTRSAFGMSADSVVGVSSPEVIAPNVRLEAYCRALTTRGAHAVVPVAVEDIQKWRATIVADVQRAAVLPGTTFEQFRPPWEKPRRLALFEHDSVLL